LPINLSVETALTGATVGELKCLFRSKPILGQKVNKSKKILITTESFETFALHITRKGQAVGHCAKCGREVEVLSIDQAVTASGIRTGTLIRKIDEGEIHGIETDAGHLLVCSASINADMSAKGTDTPKGE
jgi:hypothetical protein